MLFYKLQIPLIGDLKFLEFLIYLPEFIGILLESFLELEVDLLFPMHLLLLLKLLDPFGHSHPGLLGRFLTSDDLFVVLLTFRVQKFG